MNKIIFGAFFLVLLTLPVQTIHAVPAAPSPTCEIGADVLNITRESVSQYYIVNLRIMQVSTIMNEGSQTCEQLYPVYSEKETLLDINQYQAKPLNVGDKINVRVHFAGDERFSGIFLSNVEIISNVIKGDYNGVLLNYLYYLIIIIAVIIVALYLYKKK